MNPTRNFLIMNSALNLAYKKIEFETNSLNKWKFPKPTTKYVRVRYLKDTVPRVKCKYISNK